MRVYVRRTSVAFQFSSERRLLEEISGYETELRELQRPERTRGLKLLTLPTSSNRIGRDDCSAEA